MGHASFEHGGSYSSGLMESLEGQSSSVGAAIKGFNRMEESLS